MSLFTLLLMPLVTGAAVPAIATTAVCPAVSPSQTAYIQEYFASEDTRSLLAEYGVGITPGTVRALTDAQDADACRRMANALTLPQTQPYPKVWKGFRAGTYYIMLVTLEIPDGVLYNGDGTGIVVLDANMQILVALS